MTLDASRTLVCLVTTGKCDPANFDAAGARIVDNVKNAVEAGVDLVQLREKRLTGKLLFELTQRLAAVVKGTRTRLLVNDRYDIAIAAGADGVHLTASSLTPLVVRRSAPRGLMVGVSIHAGDDLGSVTEGADLAVFGPVFATPGKGDGVGLSLLAEVVESLSIPTLAIGGIDHTNYREVLDAGAAGFAAIRSLDDAVTMKRVMKEVRG